MKINIEHNNLFYLDDKTYYLVHCISDDFALGAGIAKEFEMRYGLRIQLHEKYPNGLGGSGCILIGKVFNLVTKEKYWQKPSYNNLRMALVSLKKQVIQNNIKKLGIPKIGCGLDGLVWSKVLFIIEEVFKDTDIEIEVRYL
jgi:hypothetical protein